MIGTSAVARAVEAVDSVACIELAQQLIRVPSLTGDESAAQRVVAEAMSMRGLAVDVFAADLGALTADSEFPGMEVDRREAVLVTGTVGPASDRSLILNGHIDVVPVGTRPWRDPPFSGRLVDGRLFGRGSCDMKAGLAAAITAAAAIGTSGIDLRGRLLVQSVVGEEDGGVGTFALVRRGQRADAAIVLEPTQLKVIPAQAGALSFRLRVRGKAAHAAVRYEGVSALEAFTPIAAALRELEQALNAQPDPLFAAYEIPYPLSIGKVRAGEWSAMVPDLFECEGRVGVPVGASSETVRRRLEDAVSTAGAQDRWLSENPAEVEWFGGQFEPARSDPTLPVFATLAHMHEQIVGTPAGMAGAPYGSDMRLLVNNGGIPTVLYGPGDIRLAHQVDESISVEEVVAAAQVIAATAASYLATGSSIA